MTVPQRLSFSAQLSNCNLATCWHVELSILGLLHLSISIHLSNSLSRSMKFLHLKITLGLALGKSWTLLAQRQKNTYVSIFAYCRGKVSLGTPVYITFVIQTHGSNLDCTTRLLRQREAFGIDPNMSNSGHHDCSTKAVFLCTADKLQCWPMLMLARHGTYWPMLVCSLLHISFIGTIASVVLSCSCYEVLSFENSPWAGFGQILDVACATTEIIHTWIP